MRRNRKPKQPAGRAAATEKELNAWWLAVKHMLAILVPFLIAYEVATTDLQSSAPRPDWVWALGVLALAAWFYRLMVKIFLMDRKGGLKFTIYPFLLRKRPMRFKITSTLKFLLFFVTFQAVLSAIAYRDHTGFTFFASVYLGYTLFTLLVLVGRRRVWMSWLQEIFADQPEQQITLIDALEEIDQPGWYVLAKCPSWVIWIGKEKGCYVAEVQIESINGRQPGLERNHRPRPIRKIHRLVMELQKAEAEWDVELDQSLAKMGVNL